MASKTLLQIRTQARQRADIELSEFITDDELDGYINDSYSELYDLLVSKFVDYYALDPLSFSLSTGSSVYTLPADFYKLLGVDRTEGGGDYYPLRPFSFLNRNSNNNANRLYGRFTNLAYRIYRDTIRIIPEDQASGSYRIWYVPRFTPLENDSDVADVMDWGDYIVVDVAIKCMAKEESDTAELFNEKVMLKKRIEEMAANRDAGDTDRIQDVNVAYYDPFFTSPGW